MSDKPSNVPQPALSDEEKALLQEQIAGLQTSRGLLTSQVQKFNLLSPDLFELLGFRPTRGSDGKINGFEPISRPEDRRNDRVTNGFTDLSMAELGLRKGRIGDDRTIERLLADRVIDALKGNGAADPMTVRALADDRAKLEATLQANLGPGWQTSTPGIQAMAEFDARARETIANSNRADLALGEQLLSGREAASYGRAAGSLPFMAFEADQDQNRFGDLFTLGQGPINLFSGIAGNAAGFSGPLSTLANNRALGLQSYIANQQNNAASVAGFGKLAGTVAGAYLGGPWGGAAGGAAGSMAGDIISRIFS